MKTLCIHAVISGKVQGVYFRDCTQRKARALGITGWVKNTEMGDVECMASGSPDAIIKFTEWLWEGSPASSVKNVRWSEAPAESFTRFEIKKSY